MVAACACKQPVSLDRSTLLGLVHAMREGETVTDCWDPADYEPDYETHEREPMLEDDPEPREFACDCGSDGCAECGACYCPYCGARLERWDDECDCKEE